MMILMHQLIQIIIIFIKSLTVILLIRKIKIF